MRILLIDNYDSFTYNLLHILEQFPGAEADVRRNDELASLHPEDYDAIVLSPGPGLPREAGSLMNFISGIPAEKKVLGVCLGHQALAEFFGAELLNLGKVKHGVPELSFIIQKDPFFKDIPSPLNCGRYHSWVVNPQNFPAQLQVLMLDNEQHIMAFRHQSRPFYGVQFHPESILTDCGKQLIFNWLSLD